MQNQLTPNQQVKQLLTRYSGIIPQINNSLKYHQDAIFRELQLITINLPEDQQNLIIDRVWETIEFAFSHLDTETDQDLFNQLTK